jgi:hypothetical protein
MPRGQPASPEPIEIDRGGKTYRGDFFTDGSLITVTYNGQSKMTPLGGSASAPHTLARLLLREIITGLTLSARNSLASQPPR